MSLPAIIGLSISGHTCLFPDDNGLSSFFNCCTESSELIYNWLTACDMHIILLYSCTFDLAMIYVFVVIEGGVMITKTINIEFIREK